MDGHIFNFNNTHIKYLNNTDEELKTHVNHNDEKLILEDSPKTNNFMYFIYGNHILFEFLV